jgi:GT2 family glycosyltransferase
MKIALYIPCFNAEKTLSGCLEAVFSQDRPADDILVIDDGSTDQTVKIAKKYPVRIIRHSRNLGLAASRNTAINSTNTRFISSLDSDCKPAKDWLSCLAKRIKLSNSAGVGGKTLEAGASGVIAGWRAAHMKQHWGESKKENPPFLFGSNTLFRRDLLLKVGAYNEKYRSNFEDVDISNRLRKNGYSLVYEPKAIVQHLKKDDLSSLLNNFWKWNFAYYLKRGFYSSQDRFVFKIKDNIGLSNRFLEEDLNNKRYKLIYLDFLIALHHSLRDFDYFSFRGKQDEFDVAARPKASVWLSLLDLTFFYHLDHSKPKINTLMPKENILQQNFLALSLVLSVFTKTKFKDKKFNKMLYGHLFSSVHKFNDNQFLERLFNLAELHPDWSGLIKKEQNNINQKFLETLLSNFKDWLDVLIYRFPGIVSLIKASAKQTDKAIARGGYYDKFKK